MGTLSSDDLQMNYFSAKNKDRLYNISISIYHTFDCIRMELWFSGRWPLFACRCLIKPRGFFNKKIVSHLYGAALSNGSMSAVVIVEVL